MFLDAGARMVTAQGAKNHARLLLPALFVATAAVEPIACRGRAVPAKDRQRPRHSPALRAFAHHPDMTADDDETLPELPLDRQIARYRQMSVDAAQAAAAATGATREAYKLMAERWRQKAADIEQTLRDRGA
jgi:hypothetical protein